MRRFLPTAGAVLGVVLAAGGARAQVLPPGPRSLAGTAPATRALGVRPGPGEGVAGEPPEPQEPGENGVAGLGIARAPGRPVVTPGVSGPPAYYRAGFELYASRVRTGGPTLGHRLSRTGGGARGQVLVTPHLFLDADYQYSTFRGRANPQNDDDGFFFGGDSDDAVQQARAGLGLIAPLGATGLALGGRAAPPPSAWVKTEFASFTVNPVSTFFGTRNISARGVGVHAGARLPLGSYAAVYGQGGYLFLRDFGAGQGRVAGPEYLGGIELIATPDTGRVRLFTEVRYGATRLRENRQPGVDDGVGVRTFRAGLRFALGNGVPGAGGR